MRFTPWILAASLTVSSSLSAAASYFQLQQSTVTVVVEGDRDTTKAAAETLFRLQSAARTFLSWPDTYREPPVLVFLVNERLLRSVFLFPPDPPGAITDSTERHGTWARTPSLVVVATAMGYERGREFRSLQRIYGEALAASDSSHGWPDCARFGMAMVFAGAELTPPNHFYLAGTRVAATAHFWDPAEFLRDEPTSLWLASERGYSCYLLSFMIASGTPQERAAFARMLTSVGGGTPLDTATAEELHQTLSEFTARYRNFGNSLRLIPTLHQVRADLPDRIPAMPDPVPVTPERVKALMETLCAKLKNCRK